MNPGYCQLHCSGRDFVSADPDVVELPGSSKAASIAESVNSIVVVVVAVESDSLLVPAGATAVEVFAPVVAAAGAVGCEPMHVVADVAAGASAVDPGPSAAGVGACNVAIVDTADDNVLELSPAGLCGGPNCVGSCFGNFADYEPDDQLPHGGLGCCCPDSHWLETAVSFQMFAS